MSFGHNLSYSYLSEESVPDGEKLFHIIQFKNFWLSLVIQKTRWSRFKTIFQAISN
jgi:hypothetical protein